MKKRKAMIETNTINGKRSPQHLSKILVTIAFLFGLSIFLYPTISNYLLVRSQTLVINDYNEKAKKVSKIEKEELKKKTVEYNKSQTETKPSLGNTFDEKSKEADTTLANAVDDEGNAVFDVMKSLLGSTLATLKIPKINLEAPIYKGTTEDILQKGIGWLEGSSLPAGGSGTHAVLTGHRGLPTAKLFTDLPELEKGDQFMITYLDEKLAYEVDQILIVEPADTEALMIEPEGDYVTLITCTPYMVNTHRLLVRGHRVPYIEENFKKGASLAQQRNWYIIIGVGLIVLFFLIVLIRFRRKNNKSIKIKK